MKWQAEEHRYEVGHLWVFQLQCYCCHLGLSIRTLWAVAYVLKHQAETHCWNRLKNKTEKPTGENVDDTALKPLDVATPAKPARKRQRCSYDSGGDHLLPEAAAKFKEPWPQRHQRFFSKAGFFFHEDVRKDPLFKQLYLKGGRKNPAFAMLPDREKSVLIYHHYSWQRSGGGPPKKCYVDLFAT